MSEADPSEFDHLRIRARETVQPDGIDRISLTVFCPGRGSSTPLSECTQCQRCHGWHLESGGAGGELTCYVLEPATTDTVEQPYADTEAMKARVSEVMDARVLCVDPEFDVDEVITLMSTRRIPRVPVVDESGAPLGIVTKTDLLMRRHLDLTSCHQSGVRQVLGTRSVFQNTDTDATYPLRVRDVMTQGAFALLESAPLARAAALMAYEGVESLVAISQQGKVVGLLSALDIARWVAKGEGFALRAR